MKRNPICAVTRGKLLKAKARPWDKPSTYEALYIVPTRKKHDSGWMLMALVGRNGNKYEIAAYCDDVCWDIQTRPEHSMHMDCTYPGGIIQCWDATFHVGMSLSSTHVRVTDAARLMAAQTF